jgi:plasmid stabilization system protein ParE
MSNHEFEYHPEAILEAWEAFHWYADRSETAADNFWEELRAARQAVARKPETWSPYLHGTRCFSLQRFPYGLVYLERGDRIIGIAVAHFKRRPGYWRKRLTE